LSNKKGLLSNSKPFLLLNIILLKSVASLWDAKVTILLFYYEGKKQ
jgi:hypothetical protein